MALLGSLFSCPLPIDLGTITNCLKTVATQSSELVKPTVGSITDILKLHTDILKLDKSDQVLELIRHCSVEGGMTRKNVGGFLEINSKM